MADAGILYVVATPIGNLEDITRRAVRVLGEVDLVAAEDTRRTRILLQHLGIRKPVVAYYDAVESKRAPDLVARMLAGESIALVSDAGTPLVADPGHRLIEQAHEAGLQVVPIPGPSAPLALLSCAGLPVTRFTFIGFLPTKPAARRRVLEEYRGRPETLVCFEVARRMPASLDDMANVLGNRRAAIGRELTKRFEEVVRGDLVELAARYGEKGAGTPLRGEVVVAVSGALESEAAQPPGEDAVAEKLGVRLARGESVSSAARAVAAELGLPRGAVYRQALALRSGSGTRGEV